MDDREKECWQGKKGKKKKIKGTKMALTDFLADGSSNQAPPARTDWAAEMESNDMEDLDMDFLKPKIDRSKLPTAPKSARGPDVDMDKVPSVPPFTAFIGNLAYETTEDNIADFFKKLNVLNVRLPEDRGRLRGFGYVEFADRQNLLDALNMNEENMMGRKVRVDLADQHQQNENKKSGGYDRQTSGDPDRAEGNWRAPPKSFDDFDRGPQRGGFDDRGPQRGGYDDRGPSRGFDDRGPSRGFDDRGSSRGFDYRGPSRGFDDRGPSRGFDDRGPSRGFDDRGPSRGGGYGRDRYDDRGPPRDRYDDRRQGYNDRGGRDFNRFDDRGPPRGGYDDRGPPRGGYDDRGPPGADDGGRRPFGSGYNRDDRHGSRAERQSPTRVLIAIAVTLFVFIGGILHDCNATCMEQWINNHRTEPSDFVLWKTKLCELLKGPPFECSMKITLADNTFDFLNSNTHANDINHIVLVKNLSSFQNKNQQCMWEDGPLTEFTNTCNYGLNFPFLAQSIALKDDTLTSKSKYKLCNEKGENNGKVIALERRSSIYRVNAIFNDYSIQKKMNDVHITLLAKQDSNCSILLSEALIFMTVFNFKPGTHELTNKKYPSNISISQYFNRNKIYVTNDGQSFIWYWMLGINILFIFIFVRLWYFTGKMFEAKYFYRFTYSTFSTYVCNPLLISAHTPFIDIIRIYFIERAWFRKILLIGSSYVTTFFMIKIISNMTGMIDSNQVVFISVLFNVLLLILFMTELAAKYNNKKIKCLPEPYEAFELSILISPMLICLIHSFVKMSALLYEKLSSYDKMVRLLSILSKEKGYILLVFSSAVFFIPFIAIVCGYGEKINKNFLGIIFVVFLISLLWIDWSDIMYSVFQILFFVFHCCGIQIVMYTCLQVFLDLYHKHAELMFNHQEWIPVIFLFLSYIKDVSNEYTTVFKECLQSVVSLIMPEESFKCIDSGNVAVLAGNENGCDNACTIRDEERTIDAKALLFYQHGVPHVTSKFYYEVRKLLNQVTGSSFSMKRILINEIESLCFRMLPIIITILVINTSNLSLDQFEGVQKYLVTFILFELFSKFLLKRVTPKIKIDSNPYFKTKLQHICSQHKEVFHRTILSKQKEIFPAMPNAMMIVTWFTVILILFFSQIEILPINFTILQLCDHLNFSKKFQLLQGLIFLIYYLFLTLLSMKC